MKKSYLIIVCGLIFFSACTPVSKKLVEVKGEASCFQYEIHDIQGNKIEVPDQITKSLSCATGAVRLSPDSRYLLYDSDLDLLIYDFKTRVSGHLFSFEEGIEGIGCIWHESGTKIACATINQQKYEGATKITVVKLKEGKSEEINEFPQTYETMLDFVCGASCYPGDFWFENENTIKYNGHNIVAPGEFFEINL